MKKKNPTEKLFFILNSRSGYKILSEKGGPDIFPFAAQELQKYIRLATGARIPVTCKPSPENIRMSIENESGKNGDAYSIVIQKGRILLKGSNQRSLLYAVYSFLQEHLGVRFFHAGEDIIQKKKNVILETGKKFYEADFKVRGLVLEGLKNEKLAKDILDWMPKNRMNSVFISFKEWEAGAEKFIPEIKQRDLILTVGGHSYFRFLPSTKYFTEYPEWYALRDGKRLERGQLCFSNSKCIQTLFENIRLYLEKYPVIKKLSLWPADNKMYCECPSCRKKSFNHHYCGMMASLNKYLISEGIDVKVEHIAYNASLCEDMLAVPEGIEKYISSDTLLAFWGRDYSYPFHKSPAPHDIKALKTVRKWIELCRKTGNPFYMLEYYNDFWMLTSLYPALSKTIAEDLQFYKSIEVDGITSLVVPCEYGIYKDKNYPWSRIMGFNTYVYSSCLWDTDLKLKNLKDDYFDVCFGKSSAIAGKYFALLEKCLPAITSFNIPLFRLRMPDIWQRDVTPEEGGIKFVPAAWSPEDIPGIDDRKRRDYCKAVSMKIKSFTFKNPLKKASPASRELSAFFNYVKDRFNSLDLQLSAQSDIRKRKWQEARSKLGEALRLEKKHYNENTEDCMKWLKNISSNKSTCGKRRFTV